MPFQQAIRDGWDPKAEFVTDPAGRVVTRVVSEPGADGRTTQSSEIPLKNPWFGIKPSDFCWVVNWGDSLATAWGSCGHREAIQLPRKAVEEGHKIFVDSVRAGEFPRRGLDPSAVEILKNPPTIADAVEKKYQFYDYKKDRVCGWGCPPDVPAEDRVAAGRW